MCRLHKAVQNCTETGGLPRFLFRGLPPEKARRLYRLHGLPSRKNKPAAQGCRKNLLYMNFVYEFSVYRSDMNPVSTLLFPALMCLPETQLSLLPRNSESGAGSCGRSENAGTGFPTSCLLTKCSHRTRSARASR
jgi:hypothetical protein